VKRPSFQFYPADWRTDTNLRRCSAAARGAWMDVLCLLHDADEYGVVRWPLKEIAVASGSPLALLRELAAKSVLKGGDKNVPAYIHTPRHAGKDGEPVELLASSEGPCWYSARFLKDEWRRSRRGEGTRFDSENQPTKQPTRSPTRRVGDEEGGRKGDGPSASASSSNSSTEGLRESTPAAALAQVGAFECHESPTSTPNPVAAFARALTSAGFQVTSLNPELVAYVDEGGTVEHLLAVAQFDKCRGKNGTYVAKAARGELSERASAITPGGSHAGRSASRALSPGEQVRAAIASRGNAGPDEFAEASVAGCDRRALGRDG